MPESTFPEQDLPDDVGSMLFKKKSREDLLFFLGLVAVERLRWRVLRTIPILPPRAEGIRPRKLAEEIQKIRRRNAGGDKVPMSFLSAS